MMDTLEIFTTTEAISEIAIQSVMAAQDPMLQIVAPVATIPTLMAHTVDAMMATMAMTALQHIQSDLLITTETVIMLAQARVMDRNPVTVMHVDHILIWTTGAIAHVMTDMWALTVQAIIHMLAQVQLATIHVQEAAMVLRRMTVSAVVKMHTWMPMDIVPAMTDTTETSVITPTMFPTTPTMCTTTPTMFTTTPTMFTTTPTMFPTTTMFMPVDSLHLTITISMDTLEIITTMVDMLVNAIQPVTDVQDLMPQTVMAAVIMPT